MTQLLVYRERLLKFYQKYSALLNAFFRFLLGFVIFSSINRLIGYHPYLNHIYIELLFGVFSMLLPAGVMLFMALASVIGHIYYVSVLLAVVVGIIFAVLYFAYIKFVPDHAYIIVAFPVLFSFHVAYALPIYLGLIMNPVAFVPIFCGVGAYYLLQSVVAAVSQAADADVNLYRVVVSDFFNNTEMYAVLFVFFLVFLVVYIMRNREWNYPYEKAIISGAVINIILMLSVNFIFDLHMEVLPIFVGTLASMLVIEVLQFMKLVLNYEGVENLQFEDDEYVYYVKAVPKAVVAAPRKKIKRFSVRKSEKNDVVKVSEKSEHE